jgi:hypothetical protein
MVLSAAPAMHKGAAPMHRSRPVADADASLRREAHRNEAPRAILHQIRAAARITGRANNRAAARETRTSSRIYCMACALQYMSGKSCGIRPAG